MERFTGEHIGWYMLAGALMYEIPIIMIFFSRYLDGGANRWMNVGAAALTAGLLVGGGNGEPRYYFMAAIEVLTLGYVAWTAFQWDLAEENRSGAQAQAQAYLPARTENPLAGLRVLANPVNGAAGLGYSFRF